MAYVMDLSLGDPSYISKGGWQVVSGHLIEAEIPKIQHRRTHLMSAVAISSTVSQPHIEPLVGQVEGRS